MFISFRDAVRKRAAYNRTVTQLRQMPLDVALDLDIDPADARAMARQAVYGR